MILAADTYIQHLVANKYIQHLGVNTHIQHLAANKYIQHSLINTHFNTDLFTECPFLLIPLVVNACLWFAKLVPYTPLPFFGFFRCPM